MGKFVAQNVDHLMGLRNCTGAIISELLEDKNITLTELSYHSQVNLWRIYGWTMGKVPLSDGAIFRVAHTLGVSTDYINYGIGKSSEELQEVISQQDRMIKKLTQENYFLNKTQQHFNFMEN